MVGSDQQDSGAQQTAGGTAISIPQNGIMTPFFQGVPEPQSTLAVWDLECPVPECPLLFPRHVRVCPKHSETI
jgi:hypothetical protein